MTQAIHIVLQGKGGVGKSVLSRLLLEYMIAKDRDYVGLDADPVNQTFAALDNEKVTPVTLLTGSKIDSLLFDKMLEGIVENNDKTVILDTGASSFLPFMEYISSNDIIGILKGEGFEVFIHTIVTGGTSAKDTVTGYIKLVNFFGANCNIVVWENQFFGPVVLEGKPFPEIIAVKKALSSEDGGSHVIMPKLPELHEAAFLDFLETGFSFDQASDKENTTFQMMARHRLKQLKEQYMEILDPIIGDEEDAA